MIMSEIRQHYSLRTLIENIDACPGVAAALVLIKLDSGEIDADVLCSMKRKLRDYDINKKQWRQQEAKP